jgi:ABC-2 type transport system ATP-binding protein
MEKGQKDHRVVPQELAYDPFFSVREMLRLQSGYFGLGSSNHAG